MYTGITVSPVKERIVVVTIDSTSRARETVFTTSRKRISEFVSGTKDESLGFLKKGE
jgi:hypothetical protein